jgi:diguanylate cyclase (GGDEF)-like protein
MAGSSKTIADQSAIAFPSVRALMKSLDSARDLMDVVRDTIPGLVQRALVDRRTGLFNHDALLEFVENNFADGDVCVVCLDLTGFKSINDTLGHEAGDAALKLVAMDLLRLGKKTEAIPFRTGGDEFVVLARRRRLAALRRELTRLHWRDFRFTGKPAPFTASKGAAVGGKDLTFEMLVRRADQACRLSKEQKDGFVLWREDIKTELPERYRFRCSKCRASIDVKAMPHQNVGRTALVCANCGAPGPDRSAVKTPEQTARPQG